MYPFKLSMKDITVVCILIILQLDVGIALGWWNIKTLVKVSSEFFI